MALLFIFQYSLKTHNTMTITKEFLKEEIASLKKQREQALATAGASLGAIQAYEYLISVINEEEKKSSNETPKKGNKK